MGRAIGMVAGIDLQHPLVQRTARAVRLDEGLFEEVAANGDAERQAVALVSIASLASGLGLGIAAAIVDGGTGFLGGLLVGVVTSFGGWLVWTLYSYWFAAALLRPHDADQPVPGPLIHRGLMRCLAFANAPRALWFFLFIPYFGWAVAIVAAVWALVAGTIGTAVVFDLPRRRALGVCAVGWAPYMLFVFLAAALTM